MGVRGASAYERGDRHAVKHSGCSAGSSGRSPSPAGCQVVPTAAMTAPGKHPARGDICFFVEVRNMRTGLIQQDARDDFDRARRQANWAKMTGWLLGRSASRNRLAVLGEVTAGTGAGEPGGRRLEYERVGRHGRTGEAMVPIGEIAGTVEPTKCFDRQFRPTSDHVRARFQRIAAEVRSGRGMDPVELYQCGGSYYVLDGHHRIAVARALGQRSVWALVTEVRLNRPAPPVGHQGSPDLRGHFPDPSPR